MADTNYDEIADAYLKVKLNPVKVFSEEYSFYLVLNDVKDLSVLDLACGDGYYTRAIKKAGAHSVTGVDISEVMIGLAKQEEKVQQLGLKYHVQDISKSAIIGKFDIVTAVYMLPHAKTKVDLQAMCDAIYNNLKPNGRLVAVTIDPNLSIDRQPLLEKYGFSIEAKRPLLDGVSLIVNLLTPDGPLQIKDYYWSRATYENCLKNAGFQNVSWPPMRISPEGIDKYGKAYWQEFLHNPCITMIEAFK